MTPLTQAVRMAIHLGETIPDAVAAAGNVYNLPPSTLALFAVLTFVLMLATFGIGAATG